MVHRKLAHPMHVSKPGGFVALEINFLISQFVSAMLTCFGAVFIFQLVDDFSRGISYVFLYYFFQRVVTAFSIPLVTKVTAKVGYRWMMTLGLFFVFMRLLMFSMVNTASLWPLTIALVFGGLSFPSYYLSFHALFLDDNDDEKIGEQFGSLAMLNRIAMVFSPIFAGFLIDSYGFSAMFIVAMVILAFSVIPLFLMPHHKHEVKSKILPEIFRTIKNNGNHSTSIMFWHIQDAIQAVYWPVFAILILGSYSLFGSIASGVMIISSLAIYLSGKMYDKKQHKGLFVFSSYGVGITWIMRFMSKNSLGVIFSDSLNRLSSPFWWMKVRRQSLLIGEKIDNLVFGASWEYLVTVGYLVGFLSGYVLLLASDGEWKLLLIPAILGVIVTGYYNRDK
ncbi:MFS transporter [Patescibacteria group bacterium]